MTPAVEALRLPTAQLTAEELEASDKLADLIDELVQKGMTRAGVELKTNETRAVVIAEVSLRLKEAGYICQWPPVIESHPLHKQQQRHVGFRLILVPSDDAYRTAARAALS